MPPLPLAIHRLLSRQSRNSIIIIALTATVLLGWLDYWSGDEFTLSFFFLVPILVSTWYVNLKTGYIISGVSTIIWLFVNKLTGGTNLSEIALYWNATVRLLFFCLPSFLLDHLKRAFNNEQVLAQTDSLTALYNRRAFYHLAEMEIVRSRRYAHPFTIVYLDVDDFKIANDRLGHLAGDTLLRDFARLIAANLRETDVLARLGGDEFVVLFPETDQENARIIIRKFQDILSEQWQFQKLVQSVSIGVVTYNCAPASVDEMLVKADRAMYKAKSLGKNQAFFQVI